MKHSRDSRGLLPAELCLKSRTDSEVVGIADEASVTAQVHRLPSDNRKDNRHNVGIDRLALDVARGVVIISHEPPKSPWLNSQTIPQVKVLEFVSTTWNRRQKLQPKQRPSLQRK